MSEKSEKDNTKEILIFIIGFSIGILISIIVTFILKGSQCIA